MFATHAPRREVSNGRPPSYLELEMTSLPVVHNEDDFAAYGTRGVPQNDGGFTGTGSEAASVR